MLPFITQSQTVLLSPPGETDDSGDIIDSFDVTTPPIGDCPAGFPKPVNADPAMRRVVHSIPTS